MTGAPFRILLTRPARDNDRIARRIAAAGIAAEVCTWPLLRIEHVDQPVDVAPGTEALIFTSVHAVEAFAAGTDRRDLPCCCVGPRTADVARREGFADIHVGTGTAAGLVGLVAVGGWRRVFYPRGRDVSLDMQEALAACETEVSEQIVYAAEPGGPPESEVAGCLADGGIAVATVWSRRSAETMAGHLSALPGGVNAACCLLAISEVAAEPLQNAGFGQITTPHSPNSTGMIETLRELLVAMRQ